MNRIDSLGTARIALSVALVMVLAAVIIPLPRPPRPVIASRGVPAPGRREPRHVGNPVQPAVPGGAAAPRFAARSDDRVADVPASAIPRTAVRDKGMLVRATPLHPIDLLDEKRAETLPPHPREAASPDDDARRAVKGPKIELGPIDDTRRPKPRPARAVAAAPKPVEPEERRVQVNVVLDRGAVEAASAGDREAVARLEARIESLQQRLDEMARLRADKSADESRQNAQILERVEQIVSMTEIQRKIDSLQTTLEDTKRTQDLLDAGRRPANADSAAPPGTPPASAPVEETPAETKTAAGDEANRPVAASPTAPTPAPSAADASPAPSTAGTTAAPSTEANGLPQILPGPPFAPRPGERTPAAPRTDRGGRVRQALGSLTMDAPSDDGHGLVPVTAVKQAVRRTPVPEAAAAVAAAPEAVAESLPVEEDVPLDLTSEPLAHESACYEYQVASRCYARGELMQARTHIRKAIAYSPTLQAPRQLSEQIEVALRGVHRSGRPIHGAAAASTPIPAIRTARPRATAAPVTAAPASGVPAGQPVQAAPQTVEPTDWVEFPEGDSKAGQPSGDDLLPESAVPLSDAESP